MPIGHARLKSVFARIFTLGAAALIPAILAPLSAAADHEKVLHSFCARSGCTDGVEPEAGLITDAAGNLYGTTTAGGARDLGTVFALIPPAKGKTAWTHELLYSFCALTRCADGGEPYAGLIADAGNLYGTTFSGGAHAHGTVFELTPPAKGKTAWTEKVLYNFCARGGIACTDGDEPYSGLIMDAAGNLYGTTAFGGSHSGGTVFALTPPAKGTTAWTHTVLYSFCAQGGAACADGEMPVAGLIMDPAGNLYGTTLLGGAGTVFELTPPAKGKPAWKHSVLYSFGVADGAEPAAGLIMDAAGNLYGTTIVGGANERGTVFELTPPAKGKTAWTHKVLYSFCGREKCTDGAGPEAGLIMDAAGNLYGTTSAGGAHKSNGTVFALTPPAKGKTAWTHELLYSFCALTGCADGDGPVAGLIMDKFGNLYGTTAKGGAHGGPAGSGTVFELTP